jgi:hypothetical protein
MNTRADEMDDGEIHKQMLQLFQATLSILTSNKKCAYHVVSLVLSKWQRAGNAVPSPSSDAQVNKKWWLTR